MILSAVKKIADGAYFVVDYKNFVNVLTPYDPIIANQTISVGYETVQFAELTELSEREALEEKKSEARDMKSIIILDSK